ncbi:MAG TPA: hypothetical protein VN926_07475 [Bradyrhizobium sp.]|jgi:hypothetical protein|nr:hypothetical protein [Bradyrhizobium sp.]
MKNHNEEVQWVVYDAEQAVTAGAAGLLPRKSANQIANNPLFSGDF